MGILPFIIHIIFFFFFFFGGGVLNADDNTPSVHERKFLYDNIVRSTCVTKSLSSGIYQEKDNVELFPTARKLNCLIFYYQNKTIQIKF
jgi:hypothetical protein